MQNWRLSYDAQKSQLKASIFQNAASSINIGKPFAEKNQIIQNTEYRNSFKKRSALSKSPVKCTEATKSPLKATTQKQFPLKFHKQVVARNNQKQAIQEKQIVQHKSSVITQDSQYSQSNNQKGPMIERCVSSLAQSNYSPINIINAKKSGKLKVSPFREKQISTKSSIRPSVYQKSSPERKVQKLERKAANFLKGDSSDNIKIDDFQFLSELGRGYYSVVYLARHRKLGMMFAIKILFKQVLKTDSLKENIFRQLKIHSFVKNGNILSMYKIIEDSKYVYMVMQYASGGTLHSLLKKQKHLTEQKISRTVKQICRGLKYLHQNDIIHRDLKLQNVMITEGVAKIGDFGCAVHSLCLRKSNIGSPAYLSPQQLNHNMYGKKIDIWSIGIIVYQMIFRVTPFDKQIVKALKNGQLNQQMKVKFPAGSTISEPAKNFIQKCLQKKQNSRMDIEQVLNHPFLNQEGNSQTNS